MRLRIGKILPWSWALVWFTLPLSLKACTISLMALGLLSAVHAAYYRPRLQRSDIVMAALFILFFAWHCASLLFDPRPEAVWHSLEQKASLLAIPVIVLLGNGQGFDAGKWARRGLYSGLLISGSHMLALALVHFMQGKPVGQFTYHAFTAPYSFGAIYYSCFLTVALISLTGDTEPFVKRYRLLLAAFFMVLLLFCASKLFLALMIPLVLWQAFHRVRHLRTRAGVLVTLLIVALLAAGSVPLFNRLSELKNTDLRVVRQDSFTYDTPLNGLTFRMLLWRFTGEIMQDENAWLTGTGIGSRQETLDRYFVRYGVYTGNPDLGDTGYLGYNFHNMYAEVLVGTGIPGLLILCAIIILIFTGKSRRRLFPVAVYAVMALFLITESVLERQAGAVLFALLWMGGALFPAMKFEDGDYPDHKP